MLHPNCRNTHETQNLPLTQPFGMGKQQTWTVRMRRANKFTKENKLSRMLQVVKWPEERPFKLLSTSFKHTHAELNFSLSLHIKYHPWQRGVIAHNHHWKINLKPSQRNLWLTVLPPEDPLFSSLGLGTSQIQPCSSLTLHLKKHRYAMVGFA